MGKRNTMGRIKIFHYLFQDIPSLNASLLQLRLPDIKFGKWIKYIAVQEEKTRNGSRGSGVTNFVKNCQA